MRNSSTSRWSPGKYEAAAGLLFWMGRTEPPGLVLREDVLVRDVVADVHGGASPGREAEGVERVPLRRTRRQEAHDSFAAHHTRVRPEEVARLEDGGARGVPVDRPTMVQSEAEPLVLDFEALRVAQVLAQGAESARHELGERRSAPLRCPFPARCRIPDRPADWRVAEASGDVLPRPSRKDRARIRARHIAEELRRRRTRRRSITIRGDGRQRAVEVEASEQARAHERGDEIALRVRADMFRPPSATARGDGLRHGRRSARQSERWTPTTSASTRPAPTGAWAPRSPSPRCSQQAGAGAGARRPRHRRELRLSDKRPAPSIAPRRSRTIRGNPSMPRK